MVVVTEKARANFSPREEYDKRKLDTLVAAWKAQAASEVISWSELLKQLRLKPEQFGWLSKLADRPRKMQKLRDWLKVASFTSKIQAKAQLRAALLQEIDYFAKGLVENPAAARFAFVLEATKFEPIAQLVGVTDLAQRTEQALQDFDVAIEARQEAVEKRLDWRPEKTQKRVDLRQRADSYKPGQPNWLTGKLNDAPEMLGQKLETSQAEQVALELERSLFFHYGKSDIPTAKFAKVTLENTYFAQGKEPRVQFGELQGAPGVEGYLKKKPLGGPRVLEFPLEDGFAYLVFDGHHRAAAQIIQGRRRFKDVTVMQLSDVGTRWELSEQDIIEAIHDLHTHLYMTEAPVPR